MKLNVQYLKNINLNRTQQELCESTKTKPETHDLKCIFIFYSEKFPIGLHEWAGL